MIVNAPIIFSACWAIVKPWLDPVTVNKVSFVSNIDDILKIYNVPIPSCISKLNIDELPDGTSNSNIEPYDFLNHKKDDE